MHKAFFQISQEVARRKEKIEKSNILGGHIFLNASSQGDWNRKKDMTKIDYIATHFPTRVLITSRKPKLHHQFHFPTRGVSRKYGNANFLTQPEIQSLDRELSHSLIAEMSQGYPKVPSY